MAEAKTIKRGRKIKDLAGRVFERLTVQQFAGTNKHHKALWLCVCQCGKSCIIAGRKLLAGWTRSCGCLHGEKHQRSHCPEYKVWYGMNQRCHNRNDSAYRNYGGRGIQVCDRWRHSFQNFASDMGDRPTSKHTLERIDNDKGYSPDNCRWATRKEQSRNTRVNRRITIGGKTQILQDWVDQYGISTTLVINRTKRGWPIRAAITVPSTGRKRTKSSQSPGTSRDDVRA